MPYCPSCGTELAPDAAFCGECGEPVAGHDTKEKATEPTSVSEHAESDGAGGGLQGRFWLNSVIGGIGGFVLGIVFASVLGPGYLLGIFGGAGLGGYLHASGTGGGAKVGLLSGIFATIPFLLLLAAALTLGFGQALAVTDPQIVEQAGLNLAGAWTTIVVIIGLFGLVFNAIFGVIGGLVGGAIAD